MASSFLQSRKVEGKEAARKYDSDGDGSSDEDTVLGKFSSLRKR